MESFMLPSNSNVFCGPFVLWPTLADLRYFLGFESFEIFLAIGKNNLPSLGIRSQSAKWSAVLKVMGLGSVDIRYSAEQPLQAFRALSAVAADAPLWRPPDSSSCICMSPSCCYLFCSLKTTFPLYTYTYAISKVFEEMLSCINICIYMYEWLKFQGGIDVLNWCLEIQSLSLNMISECVV